MQRSFPLLVVLGLAACNPYDKDLGPEPFLCAATDPQCPMGYTCKQDPTSGMDVCVMPGGTVEGTFNCADDRAVEPNDTTATATATPVDGMKTYTRDGLAICPAGDKDLFSITLATANENVELLVTFDPAAAPLTGSIVGATGVPIASSAPVTGMPGTVRAFAGNLPAGPYAVQVVGPITGPATENNYRFTVNVTGP